MHTFDSADFNAPCNCVLPLCRGLHRLFVWRRVSTGGRVVKVVAWLIAFRGVRELHTCHGGPVFDDDVAALIEKTLFILGRGPIILAACFPVSVATHYRKSVVC